jgi:hypothetical protein
MQWHLLSFNGLLLCPLQQQKLNLINFIDNKKTVIVQLILLKILKKTTLSDLNCLQVLLIATGYNWCKLSYIIHNSQTMCGFVLSRK